MRSIFLIFIALICIAPCIYSQKIKQRTVFDNNKKYVYTDTGGVTRSYIEYFGASFNYPALETISGEHLTPATYVGKTVVLNFWFVACKPCVEEMPALNRLYEKYNSDSIIFLAISFDDSTKIKKFLGTNDFRFKIASLSQPEIAKYKKISFYPLTMILNRQGIVKYVLFGRPTGKQFLDETYTLLDSKLSDIIQQ